MYEAQIVKKQVTKSRNIKIEKHEFIRNLRFCDIITFVTTCKSNTVRHASHHSQGRILGSHVGVTYLAIYLKSVKVCLSYA